MARKVLIIGIIIFIAALVGAGLLTLMSVNPNQPEATPTPAVTPTTSETPQTSLTPTISPTAEISPTPNILTQPQLRDATMTYIEERHDETAKLMTNLSWTGGRQETGQLGSEMYLYSSTGWTVKIQYPVVPNPTYDLTADYAVGNVSVSWKGTYEGGVFVEASYNYTNLFLPLSTQEQVRDDIMTFIATNHNETGQYIQNLVWTGGRATPEGLVGSETYIYQTQTWNVTMQYSVVPNPIYGISANCNLLGAKDGVFKNAVAWQGTWQNGTITETSYTFAP